MKIHKTSASTIPTKIQDHIQNEHTFFAYSFRPAPMALEITDVPPIPNTVPIEVKIKNTGVARETAAT